MHVHDDEARQFTVAKGPPPGVRERAADLTRTQRALLDLQRTVGNAAVAEAIDDQQPSPVLDVVGHGGGAPLPPPVRHDMESRFDADFSSVRVHTGDQAASSASSVQAQAYTVGDEIVLGSGREDLTSAAGQHTLAHELTHVLQQREGAVDGTPTGGGGIRVSDPSDRFEQAAEANATAILAGPATSMSAGTTQRQSTPSEDGEPLQKQPVQDVVDEEKQEEVA